MKGEGDVRGQRRMVHAVEQWVPLALLLVGVLALTIGAAEWPTRTRRPGRVVVPAHGH